MRKFIFYSLSFVTFLFVASCAKRGTITGGDKDLEAPKIIVSNPDNFNTFFNKKIIKIYFDEYINIKDLQKQLIISPPMEKSPTILPQGIASKYITIKINDTLQANTTYSINFGESIVDYNEGNPYRQLKYVFSTGKYIDSLSIKGTIKDAYLKDADDFVNVMLYEVDKDFNDSTIYKKLPRYVTNTLDSLKIFKLDNLKAGKYKLIALKEKSTNYKFDPAKDKIAFHEQNITVPDTNSIALKLFKEEKEFQLTRAIQGSSNKSIVSYEGDPKNIMVEAKHNNTPIKVRCTKFPEKDSLQIWFKPLVKDSILLQFKKDSYKKDFLLKITSPKKDSLNIFTKQQGSIRLNENFVINTATPIDNIDISKIKLIKKDSSKVDFKTLYNEYDLGIEILFDKEEDENYSLELLPNAIEDYLGQKNDSLNFKFSTKNKTDYGNLKLDLLNVKSYPIIVELTDIKSKTLESLYVEKEMPIAFLLVEPKKYGVRIIYDNNKDKKWDAGNYLKKIQPEEVLYFSKEIDVRANWDVNQTIDLDKL